MKNRLNDDIAFWHWARARQARGGQSWSSYWATLISATVENAAPTHVVLTFPTAQTSLGAGDFTIAGFTVSSASWTGTILTLVLSTPVLIFHGNLTLTFERTGETAVVSNYVNDDGNTVAWYDYTDETTITHDSNRVSKWEDKLGSGRDLTAATDARPTLTENGILFDGGLNTMATSGFVFGQPQMVYLLLRQITWVDGDYILRGVTTYSMLLLQYMGGSSPQLGAYAGSFIGPDGNLALNTFGVIRALWNGANSTLQINNNDVVTGNVGTTYAAAGGICFGSTINSNRANFEIKEAIIRKTADSAELQANIYNYLSNKNFFFDVGGLDSIAVRLSDTDDLYAHESQILMKTIGGIDFLFMVYVSNKVTGTEWKATAKVILKVFNLSTMQLLKTMELYEQGMTAGLTIPLGSKLNVPRMYFLGDNLRIHASTLSTLYQRDIDVSSDNYAQWVAGNISITQMTMKDADGADVLADVTSANINIHLDYILGDDAANYHDLMPMFRNLDPAISGSNWYSTLECSGEMSHELDHPTLLVMSTDSGASWSLGSLIGYTIENRVKVIEPGIGFIGTDLHIISRSVTNAILHFKSTDGGDTWIQEANVALSTIAVKPCMIAYEGLSASLLMALSLTDEVPGGVYGRTTLGIYRTSDFATYTRLAKIVTETQCHYPSLNYFGDKLYMSYTKGIPVDTTDRNAIYFVRIV